MYKNIKKGFTLIEMLVVVFIMAVLATIIIVRTVQSRSDARDAKRKSDLATIKTAVEMYYEKNGTYIIKTPPDALNPEGRAAGGKIDYGFDFSDSKETYYSLFNCSRGAYHNNISIAEALRQWGFFNPVPVPPGFDLSDTSGGKKDVCNTGYGVSIGVPYFYIYVADKDHYSIYTKLENPNISTMTVQDYPRTYSTAHPDGLCNGTSHNDPIPGDGYDDYDPIDEKNFYDTTQMNCRQPAGEIFEGYTPSGPYCVCQCHWTDNSSAGQCPFDVIGSYISRFSNYRVGNGK